MEVLCRPLKDNSHLVEEVSKADKDQALVCVGIYLPEYLDMTSLMAMKRRMVEVCKVTGRKLRLIGSTKNIEVEKYATRLFADRADIFLSVDWRGEDDK